jgi:hypothetical protein
MTGPDEARGNPCVQNKLSFFQRLRRRWRRIWTWLDRIDPARLIGGSDVFK